MRADISNTRGFTLVEISIVMIIIGLLIGGTFGGMKLLENANMQKTVRDIKAIESAAISFKDIYGRLPGDIVNPASRVSGCTAAPCATGGNGDRQINNVGGPGAPWEVLVPTSEKFTFWHHLQAADLLSMGTENTIDMNFGEGQPESPIGGGYRLIFYTGVFHIGAQRNSAILILSEIPSDILQANTFTMDCGLLGDLDTKMDDGLVFNGFANGWNCGSATATSPYVRSNRGSLFYDIKGF